MVDTNGRYYPINSIDQFLKDTDSLISLPEIYLKYRQLMDAPESTLEQFSEVVSYDPNLAATVLKFVNSPLWGLSGEVYSINRAIHLLGINRLHDMVLAASAMALDYPNDIMPLKIFWRCSLFSGVFARLLANQLNINNGECLFAVGLLHQIGRLVIYAKYPGQAKNAIIRAKEFNQSIDTAEQAIMGFHYGHVGAKLMAHWRLPVKYQVITYFQPTPQDAPKYQVKTALLHLVHGYAQQYVSDKELALELLIIPDVWNTLNIVPEQLEATLEQARSVCSVIEKSIFK